mgnify:CR=1 FL=1
MFSISAIISTSPFLANPLSMRYRAHRNRCASPTRLRPSTVFGPDRPEPPCQPQCPRGPTPGTLAEFRQSLPPALLAKQYFPSRYRRISRQARPYRPFCSSMRLRICCLKNSGRSGLFLTGCKSILLMIYDQAALRVDWLLAWPDLNLKRVGC